MADGKVKASAEIALNPVSAGQGNPDPRCWWVPTTVPRTSPCDAS